MPVVPRIKSINATAPEPLQAMLQERAANNNIKALVNKITKISNAVFPALLLLAYFILNSWNIFLKKLFFPFLNLKVTGTGSLTEVFVTTVLAVGAEAKAME